MRHQKKGRKLGVNPPHRKAMLRNLAANLIEHKRIKTTDARAKALRSFIEPLITKAKRGDLNSIRQIGKKIPRKLIVHKLVHEIAPTFSERNGGYTRIIKLGFRDNDRAAVSLIEFVDHETVDDIDLIVFATSTPDYYAPGSGCLLQNKMGFKTIGALDIRVQCSGFVYGLSIADQYIKTGAAKHILVIGAEVQSTAMDMTTRGRDTAVIFADGAGAVIISATNEDKGIKSTHLHSEGKHAKELWVESPSSSASPRLTPEILENGNHLLYMNGREVFRNAVTRFPEVIKEAMDAHKMNSNDVDLLVPHQANIRIMEFVAKKMGIPMEKIISNIHRVGNTTAASIPIALSEVVQNGQIKKGNNIILAAFGSGFTWASAAIKW